MAQVTKVDGRGRIKLSKEIAKPGSSIIIVDAGTYFLGIPIKMDRVQGADSWMKTKLEIRKLKLIVEEEARSDVITRARRRKQI